MSDLQHDQTSGGGVPRLRIFLSYGHDKNQELVLLIKADLEERGHDVWIDQSEIKAGDDWRRKITDGILESDRVLAFLSKHAMRDPGVCRDELAIALGFKGGNIKTILVENEKEVQPPANISHIQWLDMRDWQAQREKDAVAWSAWYQAKLAEIIRVVESDESQHFAGEIEMLQRFLQPIPSHARINELLRKGVVGRQWLFKEVETWRTDLARQNQRLFWLTGAPGIGKSAFAAKLVYDHADAVVAAQFVEWDQQEHRKARRVIRNLAFQLATRLPDYRKFLLTLPDLAELDNKNPADLFDYLLANPLRSTIDGGRERRMVIVIDALDEAGDSQHNPLVEMLARYASRLPDWLSFVVTSRPESAVKAPLQGLQPYIFDAHSEDNLNDLRGYLKEQLQQELQNYPDSSGIIERIIDKSEGIFLYVEKFCQEVKDGRLRLDQPEQFPQGLGGIYHQWFRRQFPDPAIFEDEVLPALRAILAACEPLPVATLQGLSAQGLERFRRFTRALGSLFPLSDDRKTIKPCHKSLTDWLTDEAGDHNYFVDVRAGHRALAEAGWRQYQGEAETMDGYFLDWLPSHLLTIEDDARLAGLLQDFRYLMARAQAGLLERLLADYRGLPARLAAQLDIEAAFFREKAHILRRGDADWPAHKILLQLAIEHADDSPLTEKAERWLVENRCDWLWLRRELRLPHTQKNPCIAVLEGHTDDVEGALELRDGRLLSWSRDHTLLMWDRQTGQTLVVLAGHSSWVNGALELRDRRILSWAWDKTLRLWDGQTGKSLAVLEGHTDGVEGALELHDGRILSWSYDKTLRLWDGQTGKPLVVLEGHPDLVKGALGLRDGRILSWAGGFGEDHDHTLRLWDGQTGKPLVVLEGHSSRVNGALELRNERILSWASDYTLRLWDGQTGQGIAVLKGHTSYVNGALELHDGKILSWGGHSLYGTADRILRLWDGQTGEPLAKLKGHTGDVYSALELRDGRILSWAGVIGKDFTLRLWDGQSGKPLAVLKGHTSLIDGALELGDGRILSWALDNTLRLWDGQSGQSLAVNTGLTFYRRLRRLWNRQIIQPMEIIQPLAVLAGHAGSVDGALELGNGRILSWSRDHTLRLWDGLWDGQTEKPLAMLEGHSKNVNGALKLRDGRILSYSSDKTLRLWGGQTGKPLLVLEGHSNSVSGALELSDGRILSWARFYDCTLRLWDGRSGKPLAVLEGHIVGGITDALELSDGRILSCSPDRTLRLWDGRSGKPLVVLKGHSDHVRGVLELSDGRILSWSEDETLRLWDGRSGKPLVVLKGHSDHVRGALELRNGRILSWASDHTLRLWDGRVLSYSDDHSLRLRDEQTVKPLLVLEGHFDRVKGALELSDGRILSWADDNTLRLWDEQTGKCLETVPEEQVAACHPEWLWERAKAQAPEKVFGDLFGASPRRWAQLRHKTLSTSLAVWQADSEAWACCLLPDGTLVVTQKNGQVCFLKLYHGRRRVSLAEAEKSMVHTGLPASSQRLDQDNH